MVSSFFNSTFTGLLSATAIGDITALDADFLAVASGMSSGRLVRAAHGAGKRVLVWTLNDPVALARALSIGVNGVITDEPALARDVLTGFYELSALERVLLRTTLFLGGALPPTRVWRGAGNVGLD